MLQRLLFTVDDIRRQVDAGTFLRGEDYARRGKVLDIGLDGNSMTGVVKGSGGNVYLQVIEISAGRRGIRIDGSCTCPMMNNCKHVVAVMLASLDQAEAASGTASGAAVPPEAENWLWQLSQVQALAAVEGAPAALPAQRLAWALVPSQAGKTPSLELCKARMRKDGSIAGATIQKYGYGYGYGLLDVVTGDAYGDRETIGLYAALGAGGMSRGEVVPTGRLGAQLLGRMCDAGLLLAADSVKDLRAGRLAVLQRGPARQAELAWQAQAPDGGRLALRWMFDDGNAIAQVLPTEPMMYVHEDVMGELRLPRHLAALPPVSLLALFAQAPVLRPEDRAGLSSRMVDLGLDRLLPLPQALEMRQRLGVVPSPCLLLDSHATVVRGDLRWDDYALLAFDYDGFFAEDRRERVLRRMQGDMLETIERDERAEAEADHTLAALGFRSPDPRSPLHGMNVLQLPGAGDWLAFLRDAVPRLQAAGWQIDVGENYRYELLEAEDWYAELNEEGEGSSAWFALELGILVNGERQPLLPLLLQMIRNAPQDFTMAALAARDDGGEIFVQLPGGAYVALPWARVKPILATLGELYFSDRIGDTLRLPVTDTARLAELEAAAQLRWLGGERLRALGRKLHQFDGIRQVAVPHGLQAMLRPYQLAGLAWMQFLREFDFGGILADDMGLGKTIQALAHILAEKEAGRLDIPALVVAPTSLMHNWQAEAARFAPGLRVLLLHGKDRQASFERIGDADLVLTTYALLGRDEDALRRQRYHLLILDEAQYIKNSRSRAAQVARLIDARHRLCLTGTPVQNHLGELWSQFHFLMPGLLGDEKAFNTDFRKPIEQQGDTLRKDLLTRRLKPFMLRRTKDKVATELPPKTEIVLPVEMTGAQRDLYETVRIAMDRKVRDEIDRKGLARSQIVILDALLKLRQVCCDPRLLRPANEAGSAKLDALMDLLDTLLSEGRKVLVFSQFTSMLALIGEALQARAIEFALLTGDTVDRAAPVAAFQQGQVGVFLISLKAGGVGLNLTAADTVIHYDPWWNPASENQATDRAWRIGQEQPVFVYKLIARGTLEEKIQDMQRRKGELAAALLAPDGGLAAGVGADELQAMFESL